MGVHFGARHPCQSPLPPYPALALKTAVLTPGRLQGGLRAFADPGPPSVNMLCPLGHNALRYAYGRALSYGRNPEQYR